MCLSRRALLTVLGSIAWKPVAVAHAAGVAGGQFRAGVDLVRLSVTARDPTGKIVHDLRKDEFSLLDDGIPQEISQFMQHEAAISVVILFDRSSSMEQDDKMMHARDGVMEFLKALRPADEAVVVAFADTIDMLGGFGLEVRTVERALRDVEPGGGTRLYDAVVEGARLIAAPERREKRALLILSDGEDTMSVRTLDTAKKAAVGAGVPIYAIGIEMNRGRPTGDPRRGSLWTRLSGEGSGGAVLEQLTKDSGGWTYLIEAAKRCKEICLRVADELRNQYLLGYYLPPSMRDGRWHDLRVSVARTGVTLTTRGGYQA